MERLQNARVWVGGGGLVAVLIVAIGWVMVVGPQLSSAGELRAQAASARQSNEQVRLRIRSLEAKSTRLPTYTASLEAALAALPYDSGLPAFTRQLNRQGRAHGVTVDSVTVGGVSPVGGASSATPSGAQTPASGSTASAPAGSAGAFSMQVTVQSSGSLRQQLAFLKEVEAGPRRALVTSTQVTPGIASKQSSVDADATLTTQLSIFADPQTPAQIRQTKKLLAGDLGD